MRDSDKTMLATELHSLLTRILDTTPEYRRKEVEIRVLTSDPSQGPRSTVGVKHLSIGSDWEAGMLIVCPDTPLTKKVKRS